MTTYSGYNKHNQVIMNTLQANINQIYFFGVPHLATFIFVIFMYVIASIASIWCWGSNSRPLDSEPTALTTRQWLLAFINQNPQIHLKVVCYIQKQRKLL